LYSTIAFVLRTVENEKASAVVNLTKKDQARPAIADERGSLRELFRGLSAKALLEAARGTDRTRERELEQR
jgi:hypothetical protein